MSKEGLQKIIQQEHVDNQKQVRELRVFTLFIPHHLQVSYKSFLQVSFFSMEDLRDLFTFHEHVRLVFCILGYRTLGTDPPCITRLVLMFLSIILPFESYIV